MSKLIEVVDDDDDDWGRRREIALTAAYKMVKVLSQQLDLAIAENIKLKALLDKQLY